MEAKTPPPAERPSHKNIYVALAAAQLEFTPVAKTKTGKVSGTTKAGKYYEYEYSYADLGDVLKMAIPILSRHGICLTQPLTRREGKLYLVTELTHGETDTSKVSDGLELNANQDPQDFGGDLTYWRRYDFTSLAGISTEEDKDSPRAKAKGSASAGGAVPQQDPLEQRVRQLCKSKGFTDAQITVRLNQFKGKLHQLIANLENGAGVTQEEPQRSIDVNEDRTMVTHHDLDEAFDKAAPPLTPQSMSAPAKGVPLTFGKSVPKGKTQAGGKNDF